MGFTDLFRRATGFEPYPYQVGLAESDALPAFLDVPTGLGKTAAVVLGWLWRRRFAEPPVRDATPRRLVYCLPMRVLVEQTHAVAVDWLTRLGLLRGAVTGGGDDRRYDPNAPGGAQGGVAVHLLLGGEVDRDWDAAPDVDAILVGTQDMLLSRALNRGYAMSRFRWPLQFGLLNSDCLWVMDEVQLMGTGLATTAQLQAFRRILGTGAPVRSLWMSATMRREWLATVDVDLDADVPGQLSLGPADEANLEVRRRIRAVKQLERAQEIATIDGAKEAELLASIHRPGTLTLAVVNTVKRAQTIFRALQRLAAAKRSPLAARLVLVHSRFRAPDRKRALDALLAPPGPEGTIAVSTQVVEAGVDVSAVTLVTDLAPWASLVQRFGRCNRRGDLADARILWWEPPSLDDDKKVPSAPYQLDELRAARGLLDTIADAGSAHLPAVTTPLSFRHVLRRRDLMDLFDTTPDLAGADVDVSRFVRDSDDRDVYVFWRTVTLHEPPTPEQPAPGREELCSVPLGSIEEDWRKRKRRMWKWDHLEERWVRPEAVYPGLALLLDAAEGGYDPTLGWTGAKGEVAFLEPPRAPRPGTDGGDPGVVSFRWQTIASHSDLAVAEGLALGDALGLAPPMREALAVALRWHDAGKAHPVFQTALPGERPALPVGDLWAKSGERARIVYERKGFRHELASALAMLAHGQPALPAYLAAAHHGKVRVSLRSLPHETPPAAGGQRFARGIREGDVLPAVALGGGVRLGETPLDLALMDLGDSHERPSWVAGVLALLQDPEMGPFRLAFLEALARVADWRASAAGGKEEATA